MAGNKVTLEFAGDATKLAKENQRAQKELKSLNDEAGNVGKSFEGSSQNAGKFTDKIGKLGAGVSGLTDGVSNITDGLGSLNDLMNSGYDKAQRLARANNDVMQAQEDYNQALRDSKQASIDADQAEVDLEQARLDQTTALKDYNDAVKEHGKNSAEARQAQIDLKQAGLDLKQAQEDSAQATRDLNQANIDGKTAQLDLNDAQREANPSDLSQAIDQVTKYAPLLTALASITALVSAAQWAWNAAQLASPTTWIVIGIIALVAIIILLIKHWDKVKQAGKVAWDWIKNAASNTWDFIKKIPGWISDKFKSIANAISAPFRSAFNFISDAWNNTIGRLSWTIPSWVPGIGGNSISVPNLPKFHTGGIVPGIPGTEVPIMALAGERVSRDGQTSSGTPQIAVYLNSRVLVEGMAEEIGRRGGNVQYVLGTYNG